MNYLRVRWHHSFAEKPAADGQPSMVRGLTSAAR